MDTLGEAEASPGSPCWVCDPWERCAHELPSAQPGAKRAEGKSSALHVLLKAEALEMCISAFSPAVGRLQALLLSSPVLCWSSIDFISFLSIDLYLLCP